MGYSVSVSGLNKNFGSNQVLSDISINIPEGSIYALLGVNGAGKSTFMKCILGIERADSGTVEFKKSDGKRGTLKNVGSLIESPKFYPKLTGIQNIEYVAGLLGISGFDSKNILRTVGLDYNIKTPAGEYSLGMKQRLGIAIALIGEPDLLILDEPTNGLDPSGVVEMREFIKSLPSELGTTVLVSSHILSEMQSVASHVGIISDGAIAYTGTIDSLIGDGVYVIRCASSEGENICKKAKQYGYSITQRSATEYTISNKSVKPDFVRDLMLSGFQVTEFFKEIPSLEDQFFSLVAKKGKNEFSN